MRNRLKRLELPFRSRWTEGRLSILIVILVGCSSSQTLNTEAQKAADRYAAMQFVKCGEASYATDGGQVWEMHNLAVKAVPEDPEIAADHEASRKRQGIDWYGSIHFDCSSGRVYSGGGHVDWPRKCGYSSVKLVHQKGVWLYDMGSTLDDLEKAKQLRKPLTCLNVPH